MIRTQIYLTEAQQKKLRRAAAATGKTKSTLIWEAIDRTLNEIESQTWKARLQAMRGIWKDRAEQPDFTELRKEFDARLARVVSKRVWREEF